MGAEKQARLIERVAADIPALGPIIKRNLDAIVQFRTSAGIVAILGIVWAATGAVSAIRHALGRIFGFDPAAGVIGPRLAGLAYLAVVMLAALATTAATGFATSTSSLVLGVATFLVVLALDAGVSLLTYRAFVPSDRAAVRDLSAGALLAGLGLSAIGLLGTWYARAVVARASLVYGTFAGLIGVLILLNLVAVSLLFGAELAAVLRDRRGNRR
jgi:membrane protein